MAEGRRLLPPLIQNITEGPNSLSVTGFSIRFAHRAPKDGNTFCSFAVKARVFRSFSSLPCSRALAHTFFSMVCHSMGTAKMWVT